MGRRRRVVTDTLPPRFLSRADAAAYLSMPESRFVRELPRLLAGGFPTADPITGAYDLHRIDAWCDQIGGLTPSDVTSQRAEFARRIAALGADGQP